MRSTPRDSRLDPRFVEFRATRDPRLRAELVEEYWWIVNYVVRRYRGKGEAAEDISQVAALGLVAALERYDPDNGSSFPSFAIPTALGEVRRHFRDKTWRVRVPRRIKDLSVQVTSATEELTTDLGRTPTVEELADRLSVSAADVRDAWSAASAARPLSADAPMYEGDDGPSVIDVRSQAEVHENVSENRLLVRQLLETLPERSRHVLLLRYFEGLSQAEIAERIGISQPHVSRLLRSSLQELRERAAPTAAGVDG